VDKRCGACEQLRSTSPFKRGGVRYLQLSAVLALSLRGHRFHGGIWFWKMNSSPSLAERQRAAAAAKREALERHRARLNDPAFAERQAARLAVAAAREIRVAERRADEEARKAREAAEKAAQEEAERAAREAALQAGLAAQAAAEAKAARERAPEAGLLDTRKARKAARKAKKRRT
jgi:hypothetical protein